MPRLWAVPDVTLIQNVLREVVVCSSVLHPNDAVGESLGEAVAQPDDAALMHLAGTKLIDIGLSDLAIGVLAFALSTDPSSVNTAIELSFALEDVGNHRDAALVLRSNREILNHPLGAGLIAHDAAMAGDLKTVRAVLPFVPSGDEAHLMRERAQGYVKRSAALERSIILDGGSVRGWHALLSGGVLLETSEAGAEMNGRYGARWLDEDNVLKMIVGLIDVLHRVGRRPTAVISPPDRASQILGRAVAQALRADADDDVAFASQLGDVEFDLGLIVAFEWSSAGALDLEEIRTRADLILFAGTLNWTQRSGTSPDVVGMLAELCVPPWEERMRITNTAVLTTGERPKIETLPADTRDAQVVAESLTSRLPERPFVRRPTANIAEVRELCDALASAHDHVGVFGGVRAQFFPGGPVASNRFAS